MTIEEAVLEALRVLVPEGLPSNLDGETSPIDTLGLASIDGIEFALLVEERLGVALPEKANPFVDDERRRPRTISGIVSWIGALGLEVPA